MFVLRQNYDTFKHYCTQLGECDAELEKLMENYRAEVAKVEDTSYSPAKNAAIIKRPGIPWASTWKGKHTKCGE